MPDKDVMIQIRAAEEQRPWAVLDALAKAEAEGRDDASWPLREALATLSASWRDTATLYERAKGKGFQTAYIVPLRHAATELDKVLLALEQPRRAPLGQLQQNDGNPMPPRESTGLDEPPHRFKPGDDRRTCDVVTDGLGCGRFPSHPVHRMTTPAAGPGLDALIADMVAKGRGELPATPEMPEGGAAFPGQATADVLRTHRLLVTGSRTWDAEGVIAQALSSARTAHGGALCVVHGDCPTGADAIAEAWCRANNTPTERHPADWNGPAGRGAGFARNADMAATASECFAFIRDASKGATHCAAEAERVGIPVTRFEYPAAFPGQASAEEVTAYLKGERDDLPGPPLQPSSVRDQTAPDAGPVSFEAALRAGVDLNDAIVTRHPSGEVVVNVLSDPRRNFASEILESHPVTMPAVPPVPLLGQPGDAGSGYDSAYIPPGGTPLTYTDLLTPLPITALPAHLSHSQIDAANDCGIKYRATRLTDTIPIPEWAQIGGGALHSVIEAFERLMINDADQGRLSARRDGVPVGDGIAAGPWDLDCEQSWRTYFEDECRKVEASSPVPRTRWRASRQGAENETWWNVNGPLMIGRYLAARPAEPTAILPVTPPDPMGAMEAAIELNRTVMVQTAYGPIPYRAIIDRVTVRTEPDGSTTLVIRDYKSSATMPDRQQLGEYGQVLRLLGVPANVKIVGTYFNARKGEWTPAVELENDGWTAEWFAYHVASGHARRLALTQGPTPARPSSYCGGCPVRWACPVKTPRTVLR